MEGGVVHDYKKTVSQVSVLFECLRSFFGSCFGDSDKNGGFFKSGSNSHNVLDCFNSSAIFPNDQADVLWSRLDLKVYSAVTFGFFNGKIFFFTN